MVYSKKYYIFIIIAAILVITYLHYSTGIKAHALHSIYAELYYIPILLGAAFGLRWALLTYLIVAALYVPFIFLSWVKTSLFLIDKSLHLLFTGLFAVIAGLLVDREKKYQKKLEEDKKALEKLDRLKSSFLANVSHELRTPMTSITGYTDLLLDRVDGPLNEEQEKSLKKISSHSKNLLQVINDILDIAKLESGEMIALVPDYLDLKKLIELVLQSFEPIIIQKKLALTLKIDSGLPPVYGDEDRVKHILIKLLSNAVKFTHKGGITIYAKTSECDIKQGEKPSHVEVCIEDTGIGIKEEDLKRIFEKFVQVDPFIRREYEGAGLGLSIVKWLVELHKGKIWVKSTYAEGSMFCFTLPLKKEVLET